jgi:hypothetical protein
MITGEIAPGAETPGTLIVVSEHGLDTAYGKGRISISTLSLVQRS